MSLIKKPELLYVALIVAATMVTAKLLSLRGQAEADAALEALKKSNEKQ